MDSMSPIIGMDKLNWKILRELSRNARVSNVEIGRKVGLSSPAVAQRILKMEELGIIRGHHAEIDYAKVGLTIQAYIVFRTDVLKPEEGIRLMESIPEIVEWHTVTGPSCMFLRIAAFSSKELESIITVLNGVGETSTSLILTDSDYSKQFSKLFTFR